MPGSEHPSPVPPACQRTRRDFPVSDRGLCPRTLVLAKLNVLHLVLQEPKETWIFVHSTVAYRSCNLEPEVPFDFPAWFFFGGWGGRRTWNMKIHMSTI